MQLNIKGALYLIFQLAAVWSWAQPNAIHVFGRVYDQTLKLKDVEVVAYSSGKEVQRTNTEISNKFDFFLDYGKDYIITFSKSGYVPKRIAIYASEAKKSNVNPDFDFDAWEVNLFKEIEGLDVSFLDQPVGEIKYSQKSGYFEWDAQYAQIVEIQLEKLKKQMERLALEKQAKEKEERERNLHENPESVNQKHQGTTNEAGPSKGLAELEAKALKKQPKQDFSPDEVERIKAILDGANFNFPMQVERSSTLKGKVEVEECVSYFADRNEVLFRRVRHPWGGEFYFKNGISISKYQYEIGTITEAEYRKKMIEKAQER